MAKAAKHKQSIVYEFIPDDTVTTAEIIELSELIRVGVSGHALENASDELKRHFKEVKSKEK